MRTFKVEFTDHENIFTDNWYVEETEANSYVEAFDNIKDYLIEHDEDPERFLFRAKDKYDTDWVYD